MEEEEVSGSINFVQTGIGLTNGTSSSSTMSSTFNFDASDLKMNTSVEWSVTPDYTYIFWFEGEELGKLDWSSGELKFSGKLEPSAKRFFEELKFNIDTYIRNKKFGEEITLIESV